MLLTGVALDGLVGVVATVLPAIATILAWNALTAQTHPFVWRTTWYSKGKDVESECEVGTAGYT